MMPGIRSHQNRAKGVTSSATRNVTTRALPSVFFGLSFETTDTEAMTTSAWISHDAILTASQFMDGHDSSSHDSRHPRHRRAVARAPQGRPALPPRRVAAAADD